MEVGIWTGRWKAALHAGGYNIRFCSLYWICHGGKFVTNVTPILKAGGDPFRAYFAKKTEKLPYDVGFGTLLAETAISIPVFLSFLTIGLVIWAYLTSTVWITIIVGLLMVSAIVLFIPFFRWLIGRKTGINKLIRVIEWFKEKLGQDSDSKSITKSLKNFYKSTDFIVNHRKAGILMILLSTLLYITTVFRFYIIFLALDLNVALYVPLLGATLPFIFGLIPFSPGGLVFVEGGMIGLFSYFADTGAIHTPPAAAASVITSVVIIERGISFFISTVAGGLAASYLGLKIWKS